MGSPRSGGQSFQLSRPKSIYYYNSELVLGLKASLSNELSIEVRLPSRAFQLCDFVTINFFASIVT